MTQDWTEKYRPQTLSAIAGNPGAAGALREWGESWRRGAPSKRAAVLIGGPGIGKTSAANALAAEMGWDTVEMNASDQRTGDAIKDVARRGSMFGSLDGEDRLRLIILDEADSFFGNADRGAIPVVSDLIKNTRQPLILIVNDFYALSKKSSAASTDTLQITFKKPPAATVMNVLRKVAAAESLSLSEAEIAKIAENARGDLRAAVRDLESISQGGHADASMLSARDDRNNMYDVLDKMFRNRDPFGASRMLRSLDDTDPEGAILWIDENLPREYCGGDLVRGYERLARADVFLGRVHRRQYFKMWSYAGDIMTAGVSAAKMGDETARTRFEFPSYLSKMSRARAMKASRASLCSKLAAYTHTSSRRVAQDSLACIRMAASKDAGLRAALVKDAELEPEDLAFLLGCKADSAMVKEAVAKAADWKIESAPAPEAKKPKPRGLLDF